MTQAVLCHHAEKISQLLAIMVVPEQQGYDARRYHANVCTSIEGWLCVGECHLPARHFIRLCHGATQQVGCIQDSAFAWKFAMSIRQNVLIRNQCAWSTEHLQCARVTMPSELIAVVAYGCVVDGGATCVCKVSSLASWRQQIMPHTRGCCVFNHDLCSVIQ